MGMYASRIKETTMGFWGTGEVSFPKGDSPYSIRTAILFLTKFMKALSSRHLYERNIILLSFVQMLQISREETH